MTAELHVNNLVHHVQSTVNLPHLITLQMIDWQIK